MNRVPLYKMAKVAAVAEVAYLMPTPDQFIGQISTELVKIIKASNKLIEDLEGMMADYAELPLDCFMASTNSVLTQIGNVVEKGTTWAGDTATKLVDVGYDIAETGVGIATGTVSNTAALYTSTVGLAGDMVDNYNTIVDLAKDSASELTEEWATVSSMIDSYTNKLGDVDIESTINDYLKSLESTTESTNISNSKLANILKQVNGTSSSGETNSKITSLIDTLGTSKNVETQQLTNVLNTLDSINGTDAKSTISDYKSSVEEKVNTAVDKINGVNTTLEDSKTSTNETISNGISSANTSVKEGLTAAQNWIKQSIEKLKEYIDKFNTLLEGTSASAGIGNAKSAVADTVDATGQAVTELFGDQTGELGSTISEAASWIEDFDVLDFAAQILTMVESVALIELGLDNLPKIDIEKLCDFSKPLANIGQLEDGTRFIINMTVSSAQTADAKELREKRDEIRAKIRKLNNDKNELYKTGALDDNEDELNNEIKQLNNELKIVKSEIKAEQNKIKEERKELTALCRATARAAVKAMGKKAKDQLSESFSTFSDGVSAASSEFKKRAKQRKAEKGKALSKIKDILKKSVENFKLMCTEFASNIKKQWNAMTKQYEDAINNIKEFFMGGGGGQEFIDACCDKIEEDVDEIKDICQNKMPSKISSLAGQLTPADVGSCAPNPGFYISRFFEWITDVLTLIVQIVTVSVNMINQVVQIAKTCVLGAVEKIPDAIEQIMKLLGLKWLFDLISKIKELLYGTCGSAKELLENTIGPVYYKDTEEYADKEDALEGKSDDDYEKASKELEEDGEKIVAYKSCLLSDDGSELVAWIYYHPDLIHLKNSNNSKAKNRYIKRAAGNAKRRGKKWLVERKKVNNSDSKISAYDGFYWYTEYTNDPTEETFTKQEQDATVQGTINETNKFGSIVELEDGSKVFVESTISSGSFVKLADGRIVKVK